MLQYTIKRIMVYFPILVALSFLAFFYVHLMPGDPVQNMLGPQGTPEQVQETREKLGLNRPIMEQYIDWITGIVTRFDFGISFTGGRPITSYVVGRIPATLELAIAAMFWATIIGIPIGFIAGYKKNSKTDHFLSIFSLIGLSLPTFWIGTILMLLLAIKLKWFPVGGYVPITEDLIKNLRYLFLPSFTLGFSMVPYLARMTRMTVIEAMQEPFTAYARAKGIKQDRFIRRYLFRNALPNLVVVIALDIGGLLGGSILVEELFNWPGIGRVIVRGVLERDYFVISSSILLFATIFIIINLIADLVQALLDPRIKLK